MRYVEEKDKQLDKAFPMPPPRAKKEPVSIVNIDKNLRAARYGANALFTKDTNQVAVFDE